MPHKHTRRDKDFKDFDLPPNAIAKPLQVGKQAQPGSKKRKRGANATKDDTPKEFQRLMAMQQGRRLSSALDDGERRPKTKKVKAKNVDGSKSNPPEKMSQPNLQILPGERMSDFSARVDQFLPIEGLRRRTIKVDGIKERQTKTEKKMHRIQKEWREEEAKRKEKEEEARDLEDQEDAEDWHAQAKTLSNRGKKGKKLETEDLWASLKATRTKPSINDVAQAPPSFSRIPREIFKTKDGAKVNVANVPSASGSLRRREELGEARKSVIEQYRKMMSGKKDT